VLRPRQQGGFTLVEVMVTVFVVAVGLLAAAALQAVAKKAAYDAMQRTTASVLAQDILERIRSNSAQINAYARQGAELTAALPATNCAAAVCTAQQLVTYDLSQWQRGLDGAAEQISDGSGTTAAGGLRSPVGCIRQNGNQVAVVIAWRGMTAITPASAGDANDPTGDACGAGRADFTAGADSGQSFRRVLRLQAIIRS